MSHTLRPIVRYFLAAVACAAAFSFTPSAAIAATEVAATEDPGQPYGIVLVPAGHSLAEVKAAVVNALVARQWVIKSETGDRVVANINHRGDDATLTVVFSTAEVSLFCAGWHLNKKTGAHDKLEHVAGWTVSIRKDLAKALRTTGGKK